MSKWDFIKQLIKDTRTKPVGELKFYFVYASGVWSESAEVGSRLQVLRLESTS